MNTHLERLFESLDTEADLEALCKERREEDLHLEFKQKSDSRHGNLDETEKRGFSKALSGFANADGGILVFGIETTKGQDGIDCASKLKPIGDHLSFRARLLDSILNTTQPVVDDVRIDAIASASDTGYVKCLIPQSAKPPHRAMLSDRQYWRRTATGHRLMEHYELEDVFGRRLRPSLKLSIELRPRPSPDSVEELHFFILNEGRGLARHAGFLCQFESSDAQIGAVHGLTNATGANKGTPYVNLLRCTIRYSFKWYYSCGRSSGYYEKRQSKPAES